MNHKTIQTSFFFLLLIGALLAAFFIVKPFIGSLVLAFTLAIIFHPLHKRLLTALNYRRGLSALMTILIILIVVLIPLTFLSIQVFQEGKDFYFHVLARGDITPAILKDFPLPAQWQSNVAQYLQQGLVWLLEHIGVVFSSIARLVFHLFIALIGLYYLFKQGSELKTRLVAFSPLSDHFDKDIINKLQHAVGSVIRGVIVVAVVQALLAGVGFTVFGIPNPALWGTMAMLAAFIPGIGTALVMVPAVLYLLFTGHLGAAIGLSLWGALAVGLIDNFLSPHLMGRGVKIHSFFVLLSVLGGLALFGPLGFLLGPLILSFLFALLDIYPVLILKEHHVES